MGEDGARTVAGFGGGVQCAARLRMGVVGAWEAAVKTLGNFRFVVVMGCALVIMPAAAYGAGAAKRAVRQNSGQGSNGGGQSQSGGQQQNGAQKRPASGPQPGKPSDRPTIQPVPSPGKPSPGKPNPGNPNPGKPNPGKPSPGKPSQPIVRPTPPRPQPGKPGYRPPSGRPPSGRPPYHWRPNDRDYLRRYYRRNLGYINLSRRPVFIIGGYIPFGSRGYFTPLPPPLLGYLPPPPPGYVIGYYDGYCVVYDPVTFTILSVVDLLN